MWWHRFGSAAITSTTPKTAFCLCGLINEPVRALATVPRQERVLRKAINASRIADFTVFVQALKLFHQQEGHFNVPLRFVVPGADANAKPHQHSSVEQQDPCLTTIHKNTPMAVWPQELHGMKLGTKLLYYVKKNPEQLQKDPKKLQLLREIGFPTENYPQYFFETSILPAMQTYKQLHGDLWVPRGYVVPYGDQRWPRPTWNLALGDQVDKFRQNPKQMTCDQSRQLSQLQFVWDIAEATRQRLVSQRRRTLEAKWNKQFMPSIRRYYELHGHSSVPLAFVVPQDSDEWPKELHGIRLGQYVRMIRHGKYSECVKRDSAELEALGFSTDVSQSKWDQQILPCLQTFVQEFGHCDIRQDFVVPNALPWPKAAWGLHLGVQVRNIRVRGDFADQIQQHTAELNQLGFIWSAQDRVQRTVEEIVLPSVRVFQQLHGHLLIPRSFVVPDNDAWPARARDFALGDWITRLRLNQFKMNAETRAKVHQTGIHKRYYDLRYLELVLPAFEAFASENGGDCGKLSTNFVVPEREPYPKQTWGIKLGGALWHIRNGDTYVQDPQRVQRFRELKVLVE